jgi:protocatechuate 3,4-dioxygenase beta subunit
MKYPRTKTWILTLLYLFLASVGLLSGQDSFTGSFTEPITAQGDVLIFGGRVLDRQGEPVPNARIEIWQTDRNGIYYHPGDAGTDRRDKGFQFYGSDVTDQEGRYAFRTIVPGEYGRRPRHTHVLIQNGSREVLVSQIYFAVEGESIKARGNNPNLRMSLTPLENNPVASYQGTFDFVLRMGPKGELRPTDSQSKGPYYPIAKVSEYDNDLAAVP